MVKYTKLAPGFLCLGDQPTALQYQLFEGHYYGHGGQDEQNPPDP